MVGLNGVVSKDWVARRLSHLKILEENISGTGKETGDTRAGTGVMFKDHREGQCVNVEWMEVVVAGEKAEMEEDSTREK